MDLNFKKMVLSSLDNDIADLFEQGRINVNEAMQLSMLRIMRGRPFKVELNGPGNSTMGWSDGKNWFPQEPRTYTTGGGPVPPTKGE